MNMIEPLPLDSHDPQAEHLPVAVRQRPLLGEMLVRAGLMGQAHIGDVLAAQAGTGQKFGEVAVRLKLVGQPQLETLLVLRNDMPLTPTHSGSSSPPVGLPAAHRPRSKVAESMRTLRTQLLSRWYQQRRPAWPMLAVTGVERGEGRSFVAANLAVSFAQLGRQTLLIDADLRQRAQHRYFNLPSGQGLAGILSGAATLSEICVVESVPGLHVLTAGARSPNPQELIASDWFAVLMLGLAERYDVVLVDTPAGAESADAQLLAKRTRGALVVARRGVTRSRQLSAHCDALTQGGASLVGLVYNEW